LGNRITSNLKKDFKIEFRNRFAINVSFSFAIISTLAISLSTGGIPLSANIHSMLFWIIMFFCAMSGLSHIFIREEEQDTSLFLRINSEPETIYVSKLIFNVLIFFLLQIAITPLYVFLLQVEIRSPLFFVLTVACGGLSISSSVTILAAMVAKSGGKGSLFTVISFPIILPVLWVAISATEESLEKSGGFDINNLVFLLAFSGVMIALSYILFEYIWIEE
jgi:heme exporter protein B